MAEAIGKFTKVVNFAVEQVRKISVQPTGSYSIMLPKHFVYLLGWAGKKVKVRLVMDRAHKWKSIMITKLDENDG